jgi:hypothetical protein
MPSIPSDPVQCALRRVRRLVSEALEMAELRQRDLPTARSTLYNLNHGHNVTIGTFVQIADACGCDVVINLRQRRPAHDLRQKDGTS